MHIYQEERELQDENRALAIPGSFRVDKEIAMSSGQLPQVRNHLSIIIISHYACYWAKILFKFVLETWLI